MNEQYKSYGGTVVMELDGHKIKFPEFSLTRLLLEFTSQ